MSATYTLDAKIAALDLLNQLDNDYSRVKAKLQIPFKTLRGWRSDETQLRNQFENRQYLHISSMKLHLLVDMVEYARDIMSKLKSGDREEGTASQLTYILGTLLNQARKLEQNFEHVPDDPQDQAEPPNRIEYIYEGAVHDAPPWEGVVIEESGPRQNIGLRQALEQIGIGTQPEPESSLPGTPSLLMDRPQLPDDGPNPARSRKQRQAPKRRRHKSKPKAR